MISYYCVGSKLSYQSASNQRFWNNCTKAIKALPSANNVPGNQCGGQDWARSWSNMFSDMWTVRKHTSRMQNRSFQQNYQAYHGESWQPTILITNPTLTYTFWLWTTIQESSSLLCCTPWPLLRLYATCAWCLHSTEHQMSWEWIMDTNLHLRSLRS